MNTQIHPELNIAIMDTHTGRIVCDYPPYQWRHANLWLQANNATQLRYIQCTRSYYERTPASVRLRAARAALRAGNNFVDLYSVI